MLVRLLILLSRLYGQCFDVLTCAEVGAPAFLGLRYWREHYVLHTDGLGQARCARCGHWSSTAVALERHPCVPARAVARGGCHCIARWRVRSQAVAYAPARVRARAALGAARFQARGARGQCYTPQRRVKGNAHAEAALRDSMAHLHMWTRICRSLERRGQFLVAGCTEVGRCPHARRPPRQEGQPAVLVGSARIGKYSICSCQHDSRHVSNGRLACRHYYSLDEHASISCRQYRALRWRATRQVVAHGDHSLFKQYVFMIITLTTIISTHTHTYAHSKARRGSPPA